jgi:hypothetical protein
MTAPTCPTHPHVLLRCPACAGGKGGARRTPAQARASRRNGRKGGRPRRQATAGSGSDCAN